MDDMLIKTNTNRKNKSCWDEMFIEKSVDRKINQIMNLSYIGNNCNRNKVPQRRHVHKKNLIE